MDALTAKQPLLCTSKYCTPVTPGFWLIQGVKVLTQGGDYALVLIGILAEDVLDHNNGFLHHIAQFGLD